MGVPTETGTIDFPHDDEQDAAREVDAATIVAAAVFNAVALPKGMPDFLRAAIEGRADAARDAAAEAGFVMASSADLIDGKTRDERRKDATENSRDSLAAFAAQEERRRREQVWDASHVAIGGVAMSGEDWDQAFALLSDPKMRDRLIQSMTRTKGWTKDRAEKAADDALTLAQIAQKKKDGTITADDETKAAEITRRNPDAVEMVKETARMKSDRGYGASLTGSSMEEAALGDATNSTSVGTAEIAAAPTDKTFKGAPDLVSRFDAARMAPSVKPAPSPNLQVAAVNPSLDLNATF